MSCSWHQNISLLYVGRPEKLMFRCKNSWVLASMKEKKKKNGWHYRKWICQGKHFPFIVLISLYIVLVGKKKKKRHNRDKTSLDLKALYNQVPLELNCELVRWLCAILLADVFKTPSCCTLSKHNTGCILYRWLALVSQSCCYFLLMPLSLVAFKSQFKCIALGTIVTVYVNRFQACRFALLPSHAR